MGGRLLPILGRLLEFSRRHDVALDDLSLTVKLK
jgi:hypothetical protein